MNVGGMSSLARELALKYWNMRMNFVEEDSKVFHEQQDLLRRKNHHHESPIQRQQQQQEVQERREKEQQQQNMMKRVEQQEQQKMNRNFASPSSGITWKESASQRAAAQAEAAEREKRLMQKATAFGVSTPNEFSSLQQIVEARKNAQERLSTIHSERNSRQNSRNNSPAK